MLDTSDTFRVTIPLSQVTLKPNDALFPPSKSASETISFKKCSKSLFASPQSPANSILYSSDIRNCLSPSLTFSDSDAEDILLVIDQAPVQFVQCIFTNPTELQAIDKLTSPVPSTTNEFDSNSDMYLSNANSDIRQKNNHKAARKFASPPGATRKTLIKRHIRYKDQRKFPCTKDFFEFLCFSKEKRINLPKAKKFIVSNVSL